MSKTKSTPPKVSVTVPVPSEFKELLEPHLKLKNWAWTTFVAHAIGQWLEWLPARDDSWSLHPAPVASERIHVRLEQTLIDELSRTVRDLGSSNDADGYWSVLAHYMRVNDLFEEHNEHTPSVVHIRMDQEDKDLITWMVENGYAASRQSIYNQAVTSWLKAHQILSKTDAIYDYDLMPNEDDGVGVTVAMARHRHDDIKAVAKRDNQQISSAYYTAIARFLNTLHA